MLKVLVENVENNYSLYSIKINSTSKALANYKHFTNVLLADAINSNSFIDCQKVMNRYIHFFNDGHLWIEFPNSKGNVKESTLPTDSLINVYKENFHNDPILGVWESEKYEIVVTNNVEPFSESNYVGIIIKSENKNWKKQQVKMEIFHSGSVKFPYNVNFYMGNGDLWETKAYISDNLALVFSDLSGWRKLYPVPIDHEKPSFEDIAIKHVHFDNIGLGKYYLRIKSFAGFSREEIAKTINENFDKLTTADLLIIDVRDNEGGNDDSYFPLLPFIYSKPVQMPRLHFWLSKKNNKFYSQWLTSEDSLRNSSFYEAVKNDSSRYFSPFSNDELMHAVDTMYKCPQNVAIIMDKGTASSSETFIYRAMQSNKVTTFGNFSAGVVDGFNGNYVDFICFSLRYPTAVRSISDFVDPHGIAPDVYLDLDQMDESYLINFIVRFFEQMND